MSFTTEKGGFSNAYYTYIYKILFGEIKKVDIVLFVRVVLKLALHLEIIAATNTVEKMNKNYLYNDNKFDRVVSLFMIIVEKNFQAHRKLWRINKLSDNYNEYVNRFLIKWNILSMMIIQMRRRHFKVLSFIFSNWSESLNDNWGRMITNDSANWYYSNYYIDIDKKLEEMQKNDDDKRVNVYVNNNRESENNNNWFRRRRNNRRFNRGRFSRGGKFRGGRGRGGNNSGRDYNRNFITSNYFRNNNNGYTQNSPSDANNSYPNGNNNSNNVGNYNNNPPHQNNDKNKGKPLVIFKVLRKTCEDLNLNPKRLITQSKICQFFNSSAGCEHSKHDCIFDHVCMFCGADNHPLFLCPNLNV